MSERFERNVGGAPGDWGTFCAGCGKCCGPVPVSRGWWRRNRAKAMRPYEKRRAGRFILARHGGMSCAFLDADKRCRVYQDRPPVCRLYGESPGLPCARLEPERAKKLTAERLARLRQ